MIPDSELNGTLCIDAKNAHYRTMHKVLAVRKSGPHPANDRDRT